MLDLNSNNYHGKVIVLPITVDFNLGHAQSKLPVIKANSKNVKIRDGLNFKPNFWYIMPETNPDIYYVDLPIKTQSVSFITDQDSIRFEVKYGQHYDFIILLNNKDSCYTRISATYPKKTDYASACKSCPNDTIPFTVRNNKIYISGKLNGNENINFQLDLGAGAANINYKSVKKGKVSFDKKGNLRNSDGNNEVRLSTKNTIELGGLKWEGIEMYETKNMGNYEDAIVGNSLFLGKIYEIDYDNKRIIVYRSLQPKLSGFRKQDMLLDNGIRPVLEVAFDFDGQHQQDWFLFDTGNSSNGIIGNAFTSKNDNYDKFTKLIGFGDRRIALVPKIGLGGLSFSKGVIVLEKPSKEGSQYAFGGIIGNKILKNFNVIIDNQQGCIYLKPNHSIHQSGFFF